MNIIWNISSCVPIRTPPWRVSNMQETEGVKQVPLDVPADIGFLR
jgi:hypothetical protein